MLTAWATAGTQLHSYGSLLLLCACPTTHIWHLLHTLLNPKLVEISPSSSYFYLVRMFSLTLYWALCFSFEQSTYMTVFFPFSRYSLHALMMASHCSFGLIHFFWLVWIFRKQSKGLPDRAAWPLPDVWLKAAWRLPDNCLTTAWWLPDNCLTTAWKLPDNCLKTVWQLPV